jgi:ribonuclease HII
VSKRNRRNNLSFDHERRAKENGYTLVIGIDEAGRGPLAGPVVACAVSVIDPEISAPIQDSKKLSPRQREAAFLEIMDKSHVGIGIISEAVIDEVNILNATFLAMTNAVLQLMGRVNATQHKVCLLVDGDRFKSDLPYRAHTVIDGDAHVFSIACASIVAKVTRDRILEKYDHLFPQYGFARHKGYPTAQHKEAIRINGLSPIHRRSFVY